MGVLRLLLALSVVVSHSSTLFGLQLVDSVLAVQAFYIISGFYMALVLNEKYIGSNQSYGLFISNRLLRLFPIYWIVLLLSVLFSLLLVLTTNGVQGQLSAYIAHFELLSIPTFLFLLFTNIFLFFQDIVMFMGVDLESGNLFLTENFRTSSPAVFKFLIIPQAWTVGVEIMFYLIAPFVVRRKIYWIVVLFLASIVLRWCAYQSGLNYDPWTYRFFPFELAFFMLGVLAYHGYLQIKHKRIPDWFYRGLLVLLLLFSLGYGNISFVYKYYTYLGVFVLFLPFIFKYTKSWKKDYKVDGRIFLWIKCVTQSPY